MPLDILYEDDFLIFVNKPPGIVVQQRMHEPDEPFLHDLVQRHTSPAYLMQRLDRGTSGVIFFSKSSELNVRLTRQFERKRIQKRYLAICEGELRERQTIDAPIARVGAIKFGVRDHGKRSVTHVRPRAATEQGSLLEIVLETGRTHQIRVHLAAIGHSIVGDPRYRGARAKFPLGRPFLHAHQLAFDHPASGERVTFDSPLPPELEAALSRLA